MNKMLQEILTANRGNPTTWIETWLKPKLSELGVGFLTDKEMNLYIPPLFNESKVLYVAHMDTIDDPSLGDRELVVDRGVVSLSPNSNNRCLGADNGAGIYVLLRLLEEGVDGGYLFTTGEERGGIGVSHFIENNVDLLSGYDMCLEFDRFGTSEVVYEQGVGECASESYAEALSGLLSKETGLDLSPSSYGLYTDCADLAAIIPECVNIAVGYKGHHTNKECLNLVYLEELVEAVLNKQEKFDTLPIEREEGEYYNTSSSSYYGLSQDSMDLIDYMEERPAIVAEFLESIGVDVFELDTFALGEGYQDTVALI